MNGEVTMKLGPRHKYLETFDQRTRSWLCYVRDVRATLHVFGYNCGRHVVDVEVHLADTGLLEVNFEVGMILSFESGYHGRCNSFCNCVIEWRANDVNEGIVESPERAPLISFFKALADEKRSAGEKCKSCGKRVLCMWLS